MDNATTAEEGSDKADDGALWIVEDVCETANGGFVPSGPTNCLDDLGAPFPAPQAPQAPPVAAPHRNSLLLSLLAAVAPQVPRKASVFDVLEASASIVNVDGQYDSTDNLVAAEQGAAGTETDTATGPAARSAEVQGRRSTIDASPAVRGMPRRSIAQSTDSLRMLREESPHIKAKAKAATATAAQSKYDLCKALVGGAGHCGDPSAALGTSWDAWMWAVVVVLGGQLYGWNGALAAGFGSYFSAQVIVGIAFACLMCSIAENTAALAFPGGSYGLARVVLGFYAGTMVGFLEVTEYLFMISTSVFFVGQTAVDALGCDPAYQVAFWFAFYAFGLATTCGRTSVMFATNAALFAVTVGVVLVYSLGSLQYTDLRQFGPYLNNTAVWVAVNGSTAPDGYAVNFTTARTVPLGGAGGGNVTVALGVPVLPPHPDASYWFIGGPAAWMATLTTCTAAYAGVEVLPLLSKLLREPKKSVPAGGTAGVATLFATNMATTIIAAALPPGLYTTAGLALYMNAGFSLIFPSLGALGAYALIVPGQVAMAWGFLVPTGNLLQSLAASNILPRPFLMHGTDGYARGVAVCCVLSLVINVIAYGDPAFGKALQGIAVAGGIITYLANFVAFYKLRTTYRHIERGYTSPLGLAGAAFGAVVMLLVLVSVLFFEDHSWTTLIVVCSLAVGFTVYYYVAVAGAQIFSPDETTALLRLHVANMNGNKHRHGGPCGAPCGVAAVWARVDAASKRLSKEADVAADAVYREAYASILAAVNAYILPAPAPAEGKVSTKTARGSVAPDGQSVAAVHPEG